MNTHLPRTLDQSAVDEFFDQTSSISRHFDQSVYYVLSTTVLVPKRDVESRQLLIPCDIQVDLERETFKRY